MDQSNHPVVGLQYGEPVRRVIASYNSYAEAEAAVDHLADRRFPVERIAIVGRDVNLVEQVTGRLTYLTAAAEGAAAGALPGALIGWIFGLLDWVDPLTSGLLLAIYGLLFGAIVGGLLSLAMYAMQRGRRDFTTIGPCSPLATTSSPTPKSPTRPSDCSKPEHASVGRRPGVYSTMVLTSGRKTPTCSALPRRYDSFVVAHERAGTASNGEVLVAR